MIELRGVTPNRLIDGANVYFPFAAGSLKYDCVACGAKCCKGYGYTMTRDELVVQQRLRPTIGHFISRDSRASDNFFVRNCAPSCFFLTEQKECQIQAAEGYDAKPETCRLFPFNQIALVGDYLIVAPNTELCPLEVTGAEESAAMSRHEVLLGELDARGLSAPPIRLMPIDTNVKSLVELERDIVGLSAGWPADGTLESFADAQIELADAHARRGEGGRGDQGAGVRARQFLASASMLLDCDVSCGTSEGGALTRLLVTATPLVRSRLVFRDPERAHLIPEALPLHRLPYLTLGLAVVADIARVSGMSRVTLSTLSVLLERFGNLLWLLAWGDAEMTWRADVRIDLNEPGPSRLQKRYLRVVRELLPQRRERVPRSLLSILLEHSPSGGLDRMMFLNGVANRLRGKLRPGGRGSATRRAGAWRHPRVFVQQLMIAKVGEKVLRLAGRRRLRDRVLGISPGRKGSDRTVK